MTKVFLSLRPQSLGGGSNSFSYNFTRWLANNKQSYKLVKKIEHANKAIIIAHLAQPEMVEKAKKKGCFIIHRLDEYFQPDESEYRRIKHQMICDLNKLANVTVYQSQFVLNNLHPILKPDCFEIIINGANTNIFYPAQALGAYIGHVSWSCDERKGFESLYSLVQNNPKEKFLLVGNHKKTPYSFKKFKNVFLVGPVNRKKMHKYYQMMKVLYLPSANDPCPNTAVEAILCGVPVCYNQDGGTKEIVKDCGADLEHFNDILNRNEFYREKCFNRSDLNFNHVAQKYLSLS